MSESSRGIERDDIGQIFKKIDLAFRRTAEADLRKFGLTLSQADVMHFLIDTGKMTASQKEIENHLGVSHPATSGIIKRMEMAGLVKSEISVDKRMTKSVSITEKGLDLFAQTEKERLKHKNDFEGNFSPEERETLLKLLGKLYASMKKT